MIPDITDPYILSEMIRGGAVMAAISMALAVILVPAVILWSERIAKPRAKREREARERFLS